MLHMDATMTSNRNLPYVNIHATCIQIGKAGAAFGASEEAGVLLLGPSGAGKSDLALQLIARGAKLVADDRTDLFVENGKLFGRAPPPIAGLLEARGIGIVKLAYAAQTRIALAVLLEPGERLPEHRKFILPNGLELPKDAIPPVVHIALEASAAAKIALAVAAYEHGLHRDDVNTI